MTRYTIRLGLVPPTNSCVASYGKKVYRWPVVYGDVAFDVVVYRLNGKRYAVAVLPDDNVAHWTKPAIPYTGGLPGDYLQE